MQPDFRQFMSFKVISSHLFVIKIFCLKKLKIKISPETDDFFQKIEQNKSALFVESFSSSQKQTNKGPNLPWCSNPTSTQTAASYFEKKFCCLKNVEFEP